MRRARPTCTSTSRIANASTRGASSLACQSVREVEIRSGLHGDEQIVVVGQQKVREGSLVDISGGAQ